MSDSLERELARRVRLWLVANGVAGGIPTPDSAVILADTDGQRPPPPFATVKVTGTTEEGTEVISDAVPELTVTEWGRAFVSIQGIGEATADWLRRARMALQLQDVRTANATQGITLHGKDSSVRNLVLAFATRQEPRFLLELECTYRLALAGVPVLEVTTVTFDVDLPRNPGESSPPALDLDRTMTLP